MAIKVKVHDKPSQVVVNVKNDKSQVKTMTGCDVNTKRLDLKIDKEIEDRKEADAYLQEEIEDIIEHEGAQAIQISDVDVESGSIDISLLNTKGETISTGTLTYDMLRPYLGELAPSDIYQGKVWLASSETSNTQDINSQTLQTLFNNHIREFIVESNSDSQVIVESSQTQQQEEIIIPQTNNGHEYIVEHI